MVRGWYASPSLFLEHQSSENRLAILSTDKDSRQGSPLSTSSSTSLYLKAWLGPSSRPPPGAAPDASEHAGPAAHPCCPFAGTDPLSPWGCCRGAHAQVRGVTLCEGAVEFTGASGHYSTGPGTERRGRGVGERGGGGCW